MRSMNWKEPVIENVVINGKFFPRIGKLRIAGIPYKGASLKALAEFCGERTECSYCWEMKTTCGRWEQAGGEAVLRFLLIVQQSACLPGTLMETASTAGNTGFWSITKTLKKIQRGHA